MRGIVSLMGIMIHTDRSSPIQVKPSTHQPLIQDTKGYNAALLTVYHDAVRITHVTFDETNIG
jgi:hypothetical protein